MKRLVSSGVLLLLTTITLASPSKLGSANLTNVKDTLQTSRLSVRARVDAAGTSVGSSKVTIKTTASAPANTISTANLKVGDSIQINANTYTVLGITSASELTVTPVVQTGDANDNSPIYLKVKPRHVVTFTTTTAVANGFFQILLPADTTLPNDGNPDDEGYDFNTTVDVSASDLANYDFVTGVATPSGSAGCTAPANYHCFEVHYSGTGAIGSTITINIGNTNGSNTPIAPATGPTHTEATADTYAFIVKNFASGANPNSATPVDSTTGKIGHIEAVRVTATVDPTINFTITGVAAGQTRCGVSTSVSTATGTNAPLAVPFGTMALNTFKTLAHQLTVSTNASGGYVVTASENDQLGRNGGTTPNIPDTLCDSGTCSETAAADWNTATNNGFGYSLQNVDAASIAFQYNDSSRTFNSKQFADLAGSESVQTIFSSSTVADAEDVYVCYRLSVGATQAAGDYENQVTYTATGTF